METMDPSAGEAGGWRSYRCPVCSHTDGVLVVGADAVLIRLQSLRHSPGGER